MTNEPYEMTFPFLLTPVWREQGRLTDGRMAEPLNYCISSHLVKREEPGPTNVYTNYLRRSCAVPSPEDDKWLR